MLNSISEIVPIQVMIKSYSEENLIVSTGTLSNNNEIKMIIIALLFLCILIA